MENKANTRLTVSRSLKVNLGNYQSVDLFACSSFDIDPSTSLEKQQQILEAEHRLLESVLADEKQIALSGASNKALLAEIDTAKATLASLNQQIDAKLNEIEDLNSFTKTDTKTEKENKYGK